MRGTFVCCLIHNWALTPNAPSVAAEMLKAFPGCRPPAAMSGRTFHVVVEKDEDGFFVGEVPELPGCHSQARSLLELRTRMREAIEVVLGFQPPRSPRSFLR